LSSAGSLSLQSADFLSLAELFLLSASDFPCFNFPNFIGPNPFGFANFVVADSAVFVLWVLFFSSVGLLFSIDVAPFPVEISS
jgi:hypothetical protein